MIMYMYCHLHCVYMYESYACVYSAYIGNLYSIYMHAGLHVYVHVYIRDDHPPTHTHTHTHLLPQWVNPERACQSD